MFPTADFEFKCSFFEYNSFYLYICIRYFILSSILVIDIMSSYNVFLMFNVKTAFDVFVQQKKKGFKLEFILANLFNLPPPIARMQQGLDPE